MTPFCFSNPGRAVRAECVCQAGFEIFMPRIRTRLDFRRRNVPLFPGYLSSSESSIAGGSSNARSARIERGFVAAPARGMSTLSLLANIGRLISGPAPTIDLTDDELAAVAAAVRRTIEDDKFPHAPRLDPLRAALGKFDAATEPTPKAPPTAKANKRARR